ncbi:PepSY-associated TM helix domain-containing protein [Dankookia sp. GCM10030260]|uniref:PepSY-associated TM helix domain-containing protein n=1 Tax=Dankookia sp. GCM10030260 TaxID=3273390 RepID=UPI0036147658
MAWLLRRLHRWLGLAFGAWFVLLGLTGALMAFMPEIETRHLAAPAGGPALPLPALVEAAAAALPQATDGPLRVHPPMAPGETFRADFRLPQGRTSLHLDPATGAVLGEVRWGGQLIHLAYNLHRNLLIPKGERFVGFLGLPVLGLLLAGLALAAWPSVVTWRERVFSKAGLRGRRRLANLHTALGLRALLPLLVAVGTGLALSFPQTTQWALYRVTRATPQPPPVPGDGPVDLAGALALAEAARPGWRLAWLDPPGDTGRVTMAFVPPEAWPGADQVVTVETATGALAVALPHPAGRIAAWFTALHAGTAFGLAHRILVVLLGLLPLALGYFGLALWWRARSARRALRD